MASYPGCVGSNWREMGPFWTWRDGNSVLLYGCILEGLHLYGCVYRELRIDKGSWGGALYL